MGLKYRIHNRCLEIMNEKISSLQTILHDLRESASNETKSTAGDKHETALAMLQIEQANTGRQLEEVLLQKAQLDKIDTQLQAVRIANGSLVKTNHGYFYVAIAMGRVSIEGTSIIVLSPQSPLGKKLLGCEVTGTVEMNGIKYTIESFE
jgi:hypothetical protein